MQETNVHGFQKTICNAKHFSAYDVEKGADSEGTGTSYDRGSFNAIVSRQDVSCKCPKVRASDCLARRCVVMFFWCHSALDGDPVDRNILPAVSHRN